MEPPRNEPLPSRSGVDSGAEPDGASPGGGPGPAPAAPSPTAGAVQPGAGSDVVGRHRRLTTRTALISALTLVSRLLGFAREFLSALIFGDHSGIYDAFITAYRVPNLFRRLLGEGALSTALQTSMTEADAEQGDEAGRLLFWSTLGLATVVLVLVAAALALGALALPDRMPGTGWAWLGADPGPVRELTARLAPYLVLVCLSALVGGGLMVRGHFAAPSWSPALLNVVWIATLVAIGLRHGGLGGAPSGEDQHLVMARFLCWGVLLAAAVQLAIQLPFLGRHGLARRTAPVAGPQVDKEGAAPGPGAARWSAWTVVRTSAPLALGAAVYQINVLIDGLMAEGLLRDGGPTTLYYANRLQQFPMALVAIAATTAVFPKLKALGHARRLVELRALHDRAQLAILFWSLPAAAGLLALARPTVALLLEHGAFGDDGVRRTSLALAVLCVALPAAGAAGLVGRAHYALGDFRTPVVVSIAMLLTNVLLNLAFVLGLGLDVEGLALATALTSWANLALLLPPLLRRLPPGAIAGRALARRLAAFAACAVLCGLVARAVWTAVEARAPAALALPLAIVLGAAAFGLSARALGLPEARRRP